MKDSSTRAQVRKLMKSASRQANKTKTTKYNCWEGPDGQLHWFHHSKKPSFKAIRVPNLDKLGSPDVSPFEKLLVESLQEIEDFHEGKKKLRCSHAKLDNETGEITHTDYGHLTVEDLEAVWPVSDVNSSKDGEEHGKIFTRIEERDQPKTKRTEEPSRGPEKVTQRGEAYPSELSQSEEVGREGEKKIFDAPTHKKR